MRVLVLGANGLLGSNVVIEAAQRGWEVCGTYHNSKPEFDIPLKEFHLQHIESFEEIIEFFNPANVINCAALTDVDLCEENPESAERVNGDAPGAIARRCDDFDIRFVHVSTDYVFDGTEREPYDESAQPNPIQVYGKTKLKGEQLVRQHSDECLIPRLSFVWGIHRDTSSMAGFPSWVTSRINESLEVPLFVDQWISPTRAGQAAETILELILEGVGGVYHVASSSCVTPFEFGQLLLEYLDINTSGVLNRISMDSVDRTAKRPQYTCLDTEKVEATLNRPQPTLPDEIESVSGYF